MASVYTIEGHRGRRRKRSGLGSSGGACKRVKTKGRGCTIELCKGRSGRWKFQKNTRRCS